MTFEGKVHAGVGALDSFECGVRLAGTTPRPRHLERAANMFAETLRSRRVGRVCLALAMLLPSPGDWSFACPQAVAGDSACTPIGCQLSECVCTQGLSHDCTDSVPLRNLPALPASISSEFDDALERPNRDLSTPSLDYTCLIRSPRCVELASRDVHTAQSATSRDRCVALCRWII